MFNHIDWQSWDCDGDTVAGRGSKPLTKDQCKAKCDRTPDCSFVVYSPNGMYASNPNDWWKKRCQMRKNIELPCKKSFWMQTYIKKGKL